QDSHQRDIDRGEKRGENEERAPEGEDDGEARQEVPVNVLCDEHSKKCKKWGQSPFSGSTVTSVEHLTENGLCPHLLDNDGCSAQGDERNRAVRREHFQARPHDSV